MEYIVSTNEQLPYGERVKNALNPKKSELYIRAAGGTVIASALFNMSPIDSPLYIGAEPTGPETHTAVEPDQVTAVPAEIAIITEQGPSLEVTIPQQYAADFQAVPLDSPSGQLITDYTSQLEAITNEDLSARITIQVEGMASDESEKDALGGDANLGQPSSNNNILARDRAMLAESAAVAGLKSDRISIDEVTWDETILGDNEIAKIDQIASSQNLSRAEMIRQFNAGQSNLDSSQSETLNEYLTSERGATFTSVVIRELPSVADSCDEVFRRDVIPGRQYEFTTPGNDGWRVDIIPGFIPPLPGLRRKRKNQTTPDSDETLEAARDIASDVQSAPQAQPERPLPTSQDQQPETNDTPLKQEDGRNPSSGGGKAISPYQQARLKSIEDRSFAVNRRAYEPYQLKSLEWYTQRYREDLVKRNRRIKLGVAAVLPVIAAFPWPSWSTESAESTPDVFEDCAVESTEPGYREEFSVSWPVIDLIDDLTGDHLAPTGAIIDRREVPDVVTRTESSYTRFEVDYSGKVIGQTEVPASITRSDDPAVFAN